MHPIKRKTLILQTLGTLSRNREPTRCKHCGSGWGIRDSLLPTIDPYTIVGHTYELPSNIYCGLCGRMLE